MCDNCIYCSIHIQLYNYRRVVEELMNTEEAYVQDLKLVVDVSEYIVVIITHYIYSYFNRHANHGSYQTSCPTACVAKRHWYLVIYNGLQSSILSECVLYQ